MNVMSLFDGISCGMLALKQANIQVDNYYASEIDVNTIAISQKNFPEIKQIGDVNNLCFENWQGKIDLLIGGSPCQSLSIARGEIRTNLEGKSKLFFKYVEALKAIKPKYFLFENVASMNKESKETISKLLGCQPILLNSNCFTAQDRPRYYWTNIPLMPLPSESKLKLADIMESSVEEKYFYSQPPINVDISKQVCANIELNINEMHKRVFNPKFKVHTLTAVCGGNQQKKVLDGDRVRKLTPLEYERLQGLPDGYTEGFSDSVRYKAIGNGWTVPAIAWLLKKIK